MAKRGRPKNLKSPEEFAKLWEQYKEYIDQNPDLIEKATNKGIQVESVKKPYLRQGFEAFAFRKGFGLIHQYIDNDGGNYADFLGVVTCARREWEEDQIGGTLTGRYKAPHLTARLNGLSDKKEVKQEIDVTSLPPYMRPKDE